MVTVTDIISDIIAGLALVVSLVVAYKTVLTRFRGRAWPASHLTLSHIDNIPSIGLVCSAENAGARPGMLDDLRLVLKHNETAASYVFYAHLFRKAYGAVAGDQGTGLYFFSAVSLPSKEQSDLYVLFRPVNDKFTSQEGSYEFSLEALWYRRNKWESVRISRHFELNRLVAERWNDPSSSDIYVQCAELVSHRKLFE